MENKFRFWASDENGQMIAYYSGKNPKQAALKEFVKTKIDTKTENRFESLTETHLLYMNLRVDA